MITEKIVEQSIKLGLKSTAREAAILPATVLPRHKTLAMYQASSYVGRSQGSYGARGTSSYNSYNSNASHHNYDEANSVRAGNDRSPANSDNGSPGSDRTRDMDSYSVSTSGSRFDAEASSESGTGYDDDETNATRDYEGSEADGYISDEDHNSYDDHDSYDDYDAHDDGDSYDDYGDYDDNDDGGYSEYD
ncbi:hypothetical protein DL93DRAFT_2227131 [Clavulina sp. PMI_390]|nr:hypothetical protein DL93DRAFT_2227131 [Clavulina sp. PMI_390]